MAETVPPDAASTAMSGARASTDLTFITGHGAFVLPAAAQIPTLISASAIAVAGFGPERYCVLTRSGTFEGIQAGVKPPLWSIQLSAAGLDGFPSSIAVDPNADFALVSVWSDDGSASRILGVSGLTTSRPSAATVLSSRDRAAFFGWSAQYSPSFALHKPLMAFVRNGDIWIGSRSAAAAKAAGSAADWLRDSKWDLTRLLAVAEFDEAAYRADEWNVAPSRVSLSPSGNRLAYDMRRLGGTGEAAVYVAEVRSGRDGSITASAPRRGRDNVCQPAFGGTDDALLVVTADGRSRILRVDVRTGRAKPLATGAWPQAAPRHRLQREGPPRLSEVRRHGTQ